VTPEKSFTGDLGVDSMTMLEAVVALEDRFGLLIADDDWAQLSTVGDLVSYLQRAGVGTPT
jgi:acyl carrier protein